MNKGGATGSGSHTEEIESGTGRVTEQEPWKPLGSSTKEENWRMRGTWEEVDFWVRPLSSDYRLLNTKRFNVIIIPDTQGSPSN